MITTIVPLIFIIGIVALLIFKNVIGLNYTNIAIPYCANLYLTMKYSFFLKQIYATQFILANLSLLLTIVNLIFIILYFIKLRKE